MKKVTLLGMAFAMMLSVSPAMAASADSKNIAQDGQFQALTEVGTVLTPMTEGELNAVEGKGRTFGNFNYTKQVNRVKKCILCGGSNYNATSQKLLLLKIHVYRGGL